MNEENKERLMTKSIFPFNLFSSPDYYGSAEIFAYLGNLKENIDKKVWYYEEAAKIYLMGDVEYSRYQAFQMYEKKAQMCEESDPKKSIDAYKKFGIYSKKCGREILAAVSFHKAAEILRNEI